jgi:hypothetical protein
VVRAMDPHGRNLGFLDPEPLLFHSSSSSIIFFVHLVILILVLGVYSGLSGIVKKVYLFSLCVVSLLSSRFTASELVWLPNFLEVFGIPFFLFH